MPWHSVRGHDGAVEILRRAFAEGRPPHALLFVGPEGIGKRTFALTLARALLCERNPAEALDPCGACPGCIQVAGGTHPDLLTAAKPEDKHELPIAVIRKLTHDLALKPARGGWKVAIVDDGDSLNDEAANAFLKTLEEPPPRSILILIGTSAELQLETILSRCRTLRFEPLAEPDLAAILREQGLAASDDEAARLAKLGEGSVARARGLADAALASFRRDLIDTLAGANRIDAPALAKKVEAFINDAGKEAVLRRGRAALLAGELARFFRGVLWQTAGLEPPAADPNDRRAAAALADRLAPEDVFVLAERCMEADYQVRRMASVGLIVDSLIQDLARTAQPARSGR